MSRMKDSLLWLALAITLVLVFLVNQQEDEVMVSDGLAPAPRVAVTPQQPLTTEHEPRFFRDTLVASTVDIFAVAQPVEENIPTQQRQAAPPTPANPFTYIGKLVEAGEVSIFLTNGRQKFVVKKGDIVDSNWKVIAIQATEMELLNLPTLTSVRVQIGALL